MSELGIGPEQAHLNEEGRVHWIQLERRSLPDARLCHLLSFKQLTGLSLVDSGFTDACIPHLLDIHTLRTLYVGGTKLTPAGIRQLEKARPKLHVLQDGDGLIQFWPFGLVKINKDMWGE